MSPQGQAHAARVAALGTLLTRALDPSRFCVRAQSPLDVGEDSALEPDVAVVAWPCDAYQERWPECALLVIEVAASSLAGDRKRKPALYAKARIPEYWIVDLNARRLEARRDPADAVTTLGPEDRIEPVAVPVGSLAVRDLLPR